jgi:hypothetical protein
MLYRIRAKPISSKLKTFNLALRDGTIQRQTPDGQEIVASMKRAIIDGDEVQWYERCFCNPPLAHERSTVYDRYFIDMQIEPVDSVSALHGESFWKKLATIGNEQEQSSTMTGANRVEYVPSTTRLI